MLASSEAEAAQLSISNGFRSAGVATSVGWDFTIHAEGSVTVNEQTVPSTVDLACSADTVNQILDCVGGLEIGPNSVDIRLAFQDGEVGWGIDANASTLFRDIHEQWSHDIVAREVAPGWSAIPFYGGGQWRWWYYQTGVPLFIDGVDITKIYTW